MHIGCARVSTDGPDQTTDLQRDALIEAGDLFEYRVSGSRDDRPALKAALDYGVLYQQLYRLTVLAQLRDVIDAIACLSSAKKFQASQHLSTISS